MKENNVINMIDDIIDGFELVHENNKTYEKVTLHRCCVCRRYKQYGGDYVEVNSALRHIFETNEHYEISDGYCGDCNPLAHK